jgi:type I restriction enzyme, S subunit
LGEVPEHWAIWKVSHFSKVGNGSTPDRDKIEYWHNGVFPWLNSSYVNLDLIEDGGELVSSIALKECHLPIVPKDSLLIGITGQGKTRGMCGILKFEATINQHIAYVSPNASIYLAHYLRALFASAYEFMRLESDGGGSTKGAITCEQISAMRVPIPPIDEQKAIASYIEKQTGKIDTLQVATEKSIGLLKERRAALISAAVTGQIRVA